MNTRLQVEHPVTELVTGMDLVRTQIRVAEGRPLPWRQDEITAQGHAIECRMYAEDPENGLHALAGPDPAAARALRPGVRIDSGHAAGRRGLMYYDPMIAKLSVHAGSRQDALDRAVAALKDYAVLGVTTNVEYLMAILQHGAFADGRLHTGFLDEHLPEWNSERSEDGDLALAISAVEEHTRQGRGSAPATPSAGAPARPGTCWGTLGRFRVNGLD